MLGLKIMFGQHIQLKWYHYLLIGKKLDANHSALTEEIETNPKSPKFKVGDKC